MSWWGKMLGGYLGFVLGGPLGALIGAAMGHNFDKGIEGGLGGAQDAGADNERIQLAFFTATFSVMGYIAKADGTVSKDEIKHAEAIMSQMQLNKEMRKTAINLFNEGKKTGFDLDAVLMQFKQEAGRRTNLYRMFMEIQIQAAYADGAMDSSERIVLLRISKFLGFPEFVFRQLESLVKAAMAQGGFSQAGGRSYDGADHRSPRKMNIHDAYDVLGVTESSSKAEIKRAYRRLISQHHPDKLVAKGLPEEMIKLANEKTAQITKSYEAIKTSKGW